MSPIQTFKVAIVDWIGISKDGIHIYIGCACFVLALLVSRRRVGSYQMLLPGFIVSLLLEAIDLGDDYLHRGVLVWSASLKDIINTNLIPVVLTIVFRSRRPAA